MAEFAEIGEDNRVVRVTVVSDADCVGRDFAESESVGQQFIASLGVEGIWKKTDFIHRESRANVGSIYFADTDTFTVAEPYASWVLNSARKWVAPKAKPTLDGTWLWDEAAQEWKR